MECRVEFDYEAQESDELNLKKGDIITNVVTKMDGWWEGTLNGTGLRGMFPDNFVKVVTSHSSSSGDEVQSSGDTAVQLRKKSGSNPRRLKALFSYSPEQEDELHLDVGDVVDFIAEVEDGWWRGELKGRTGIFPSNFVSEVETTTTTVSVASTLNGNKNGANELHLKNEHVGKHHDKNRTSIKVPPDVVPTERPTLVKPEDEHAPKLPPKPVRETARCFYPYPAQNEDELNLEEGDIVLIISKDCEDEGWWRGELRGKSGLFPDNFVQIISPNEPMPSTPFPSTMSNTTGQPTTMTATERTSDELSSGIAKKKELPSPVGGINTTTVTVVDGGGNSKFSFDKEKDLPSPKESSVSVNKFLRSLKVKESSITTGQHNAKQQHTSGVSSNIVYNRKSDEILRDKSLDGSSIDPIQDFNEIGRGEKLIHLTANRAKAPRRRPPSTGTPKDNETNSLNGSATSSFEETRNSIDDTPQTLESPTTPFNLSHKSMNTNSAITTTLTTPIIGNDNFIQKDISPNLNPAMITSTPKAPWLAELREKQDKKQSPGSNIISSSSSISPIPAAPGPIITSVTPPQLKDKRKDSNTTTPHIPITFTRGAPAPPLPIKPILPQQVSPASGFDRTLAHSPTSPNPPQNSPITNQIQSQTTVSVNTMNSSSTTITNNNNISNVASKFGGSGQKRSITTINHINTTTPNIGNNNIGSTGDTQIQQQQQYHNTSVNSSGNIPSPHARTPTPEWVSYEEHAKLRDRVSTLENEMDILRKQLKILVDKNFNNSKGHIV